MLVVALAVDRARFGVGVQSGGLGLLELVEVGSGGAVMTGGLIDAGKAAELLGVPKSWVLAEARANRIPHIRLGRYVRFEARALEAWWTERLQGPQGRSRRQAV